MIYLDTHMVVWLYAGEINRISNFAKNLIKENDILISPMVVLELKYLHEIDRISVDAEKMITDLANRIGLEVCRKDFYTIVTAALHITWTRDPFDRIITGNAEVDDNMLVTKDQILLDNYKNAVW